MANAFFNSFGKSPSRSFFWSLFFRIKNEHVGSLSKSPYLMGMRENENQIRPN